MSLPPAEPGRKRRIGGGVVRTKFFDSLILTSCGVEDASAKSWLPTDYYAEPVRQVVMLGAGLDARPWRLPLPENVRWYEIDQAELHRAKGKALLASRAPLQAADNAGASIPLNVSEVVPISADLTEAGWPRALQEAGLDSQQPVHWHAEGLLSYLTADAVRNILIEASQACKAGSVLTFDALTEERLVDFATKHMLQNMRESFSRQWGAPMPVEKYEEFMRGCGWKLVKVADVNDLMPQVAPGFEYNKLERPQGRTYQYVFGVWVSLPPASKT